MEKKAFSRIQNTPESQTVLCPMEKQRKELAKIVSVEKKREKGAEETEHGTNFLWKKTKKFSKQ